MRNNILSRIIVVILLSAFLTCAVGKVTRVSAVGTTIAAVAGAATLAVGVGFLSYCALSGMAVNCPNTMDEVKSWITGIGEKVMQYPSGRAAYNDVYQQMVNDPLANMLDRTWEWTTEKLLGFANDFSDTRLINDIVGYMEPVDTYYEAANGFAYNVISYPQYIAGDGAYDTFAYYESIGFTFHQVAGPKIIRFVDGGYTYTNLFEDVQVRNYLTSRGTYIAQKYVDGQWIGLGSYAFDSYTLTRGGSTYYLQPKTNRLWYEFGTSSGYMTVTGEPEYSIPFFPDAVIYDSVNDVDLPLVVPESERPQLPQWTDPDNNNRPIIPWVPTPVYPPGIDIPPQFTNPPTWGFPLSQLLDLLAELGETLFNLLAMKELLNEYAGSHGDTYYIAYDDSDNDINYYEYQQINNYNEGDQYVTYDIDVSTVDEHLPVDLNTISLYTDNTYLDSFKRSAQAGGSIIRDLVVFWYDTDPEIVYVLFGTCILTLIAAFVGKWGHS